jgi:outer membrane protein
MIAYTVLVLSLAAAPGLASSPTAAGSGPSSDAGATTLTLAQVRERSRRNAEVRRLELERMRAAEQVQLARAAIHPQLNLGAGANAQASQSQRLSLLSVDPSSPTGFSTRTVDTPPSSRSTFELSLRVSQLLYDGGRWWNQIALAGAQEEAAAGQASEQLLAAELEGIRRFYELYRAQEALLVLEETVKRSELQLERARAFFQAGRANKRESIDAEVNLGTDRIGVVRQRQRVISAQVDLAAWLGLPGEGALVAAAPNALDGPRSDSALTVSAALSEARARRPLLRALDSRLKGAERGVDVAGASFWPKVSVNAAAIRQAPSAPVFVGTLEQQNSVSAGATLEWNLFDGFATTARKREAGQVRDQAQVALEQGQREVMGEVRRTVEALATQHEVATIARANRSVAAAGLDLAEQRFLAGSGSTLEVRDAQLKMTQADLARVESAIDVEIARAAVERVTGSSPPSDTNGETR